MSDLEMAQDALRDNGLAFVLVKDGRVLDRGTREGIAELLEAVERLGAETHGASLADKIVGKAVALVAVHAGVKAVSSPLMSEAAVQVMTGHGIEAVAEE